MADPFAESALSGADRLKAVTQHLRSIGLEKAALSLEEELQEKDGALTEAEKTEVLLSRLNLGKSDNGLMPGIDTSEDNFLSDKKSPKAEEKETDSSPAWSEKDIISRYIELSSRKDEWDDPDEPGFVRVVVSREQFYQETSSHPKVGQASTDDDDDDDDGGEDSEEVVNQSLHKKRDPIQHGCYTLKIIYEKDRTGLEESKEFPIQIGAIIAARYQIQQYIGSAAFSKAVQCLDLHTKELVCIKIIENDKEFLDQSLDEIKILKTLKSRGDPDAKNVLKLYDYFYYKEHLFIVCELLRDNLYEFYKYNRESGDPLYFTLTRLKRITRQCLEALEYAHSLNLIHCDLKPENILIKSYSRCEVKIIDFGSSCYVSDHLCSYVQSRAYRAPEVILGLPYDTKIDIWSFGCVLYELFTGKVLFLNDSLTTLLARVNAILGPFTPNILKGRYAQRYYSTNTVLFERRLSPSGRHEYSYLYPKETSLAHLLPEVDESFVHFLSELLQFDPAKRPSATKALRHPWLQDE
mmetsp:Transcript_12022/g.18305  ORF Transcript_12022/g.18305 Transcript_12022/m.18305 type:complete len:523 (-) Transcript_12022:150-1718(-)|eukprot:CAMPEP_0201516746 /NCGR_PEP_ID=MMETSP0161_2-20130828/8014_1 /ASSEMBLY_ACC=CAM_ASM_000251 /TAXON_ID=180227 /ORGANISM="Neoparamoeba aestuarina, Strain SoJaBio B1-5/56/2" /LENGTH=522 /DNA_ID=CAMNT_0047914013 /DNA_START=102 /DNA_END=1670 /DNA_ORIENTATION=+